MIALIFALTTVLTPTLHIDAHMPVVSGYSEPGVMAAECVQTPYYVQFVWRVAVAETPDTDAIHNELMAIVERINYLFWMDSNSDTWYRLPAWKMTADCRLDIMYIGAYDPVPEITGKMILIEKANYCGMAYLYADDRPGPSNANNQPSLAFVSRGCLNAHVVAHELMHALGAVQLSAPNSDGTYHARETGDVMSRHLVRVCDRIDTIDCGKDDYFSLQPSGYLADHWNTADNLYLFKIHKHVIVMTPFFRSD